MQNIKLLSQKEEIEAFLNSILKAKFIAIDIEFMRRDTFFPEPCVIQISDGEIHSCIDLTISLNFKNIFKEIFNNKKTIIIHSCRQDLEILYMILGFIPKNIFDTQFAASFLGYKYQIGYAELMKEIFNIEIDKTEKMTNWKRRPLSEDQIKYALNDVIYLKKLYEYLNKELIKTKKINYFKEEIENFISDIDWNPKTEKSWKRIKSINNLDNNTKNAAKVLTVWREKKAIKLNLPRNWVLTEKEIIEISKNYVLNKKIDLPKNNKILNNYKDSIEIQSEIENLSAQKTYKPNSDKKIKNTDEYKRIAGDLYEYYKSISIENNISYQIVSPKKMILSYLNNGNNNSRLINGWRRELIDIDKISNITAPFFNINH